MAVFDVDVAENNRQVWEFVEGGERNRADGDRSVQVFVGLSYKALHELILEKIYRADQCSCEQNHRRNQVDDNALEDFQSQKNDSKGKEECSPRSLNAVATKTRRFVIFFAHPAYRFTFLVPTPRRLMN